MGRSIIIGELGVLTGKRTDRGTSSDGGMDLLVPKAVPRHSPIHGPWVGLCVPYTRSLSQCCRH